MFVAIVLIMFAGIPFIPVNLSTIKFDTTRSEQCQVKVPQPADTGWGTSYTALNNQSALVLVWWFFMYAISKAVTGAAVAAIPCGTDLRQIRMDVDATRINDPVLAQEVADFTHDCYGPSRAKLFMNRPTLSDAQMNDVTWIGSNYFLYTGGFYDTYHSSAVRTAWPYDASRDAGLAQVDSGGGYPTCRQWRSDGRQGLRSRLLAQVDPDLLTRIGKWAGFLSQAEVDDSVIRATVSPQQQKMNQGQVYADYGGQVGMTLPNEVTRGAGDVGLAVGSLGFFPAMDVVREALPMVLSFLKIKEVTRRSIVVGYVRINPPVALVVEAEAVGAFPPLRLRIILIQATVLRKPSCYDCKYQQQCQPKDGVEQDGHHAELDDPQRGSSAAGGHPLSHQPGHSFALTADVGTPHPA
ncbi:hypothetical protein A33K_14559 [Burkholderia humptydooensis MSMB43]|uniref:TraG N-terminal Proteobacteria domain-containing protein n=1 Tax=Burkholderia humptydooensis MSMB43 TaxID=441157 RepID=A0ABN0G8S6_9BURK|nr:hypothetical protein A33K_14559 [Burkholderia humptydooensis MSMB43]